MRHLLFIALFISKVLSVSATVTDTVKINKYYSISQTKLKEYNYQVSNIYIDSAILLSKNQSQNYLLYKLFLQKGRVNYSLQNLDTAMYYLQESKRLNESIDGDITILANAYLYMGFIHSIRKNRNQCIENINVATKLFDELKDYKETCRALNAVGLLYSKLEIFDTAMSYYYEGLGIATEHKLEKQRIKFLINIANIYSTTNELHKALDVYAEAYKGCETIGDSLDMVTIAVNRAVNYYSLGETDEAMREFLIALNKAEDVNDYGTIHIVSNNIGLIYRRKLQYDSALFYFKKAEELCYILGSESGLLPPYINMGNTYKAMGKYNMAMEEYKKELRISLKYNRKRSIAQVYWNITLLYKSLNKFEDAYLYLDKYVSLRDTIFEETKLKNLTKYQAKFNKYEDEAKILELENVKIRTQAHNADLTYQRNVYVGLILFSLFVIVSMLVFYRWRNKKNKLIAEQRLKQMESERKLNAARSVLEGEEKERKRIAQELHDGIGVLLSTASIHFSNVEDKADKGIAELTHKAKLLLDKASKEVRHISHNMMPGVLSKFGVFEALTDTFESLEDDSGIKSNFKIEGKKVPLDENSEIMIYRILLELINNTLKHAGATEVSCIMKIDKDKLEIEYKDNGKGFDLSKLQSKNSFGLNGIQSRIDFLNGDLKVDSESGKGSRYVMVIPISVD